MLALVRERHIRYPPSVVDTGGAGSVCPWGTRAVRGWVARLSLQKLAKPDNLTAIVLAHFTPTPLPFMAGGNFDVQVLVPGPAGVLARLRAATSAAAANRSALARRQHPSCCRPQPNSCWLRPRPHLLLAHGVVAPARRPPLPRSCRLQPAAHGHSGSGDGAFTAGMTRLSDHVNEVPVIPIFNKMCG